ncbi:MAG: non-canonical purine NTP pyrophosphatase [Bauldia sp.]|nr:non-canonical purine NTP pyrophosphatase [Bauldia sp.]
MLRRGDTLVVASHNPGKLREMTALLAPYGLRVRSAAGFGLAEPEETGTTFEANAILKAVAAARASGYVALADDSGLAVDALGGDPGVQSARWAGPEKDFALAMRTVEDKLEAKGAATPEKRRARFVAVLCLAEPGGRTEIFRGEVAGALVWPPRGTNGFGYDPMFQPEGHAITFGEMSADAKHGWSHGGDGALSLRARAFAAFAAARLK